MADLPTGTLTFLFTDIEGSTWLWDRYPDSTSPALIRHDALIETCVARHFGTLVRPRGEGDSRFAVFIHATDAVAAACDIQRDMYAEFWPTPQPLRVRIALHTGEADLRAGDYYGSAVNRCARLRSTAHGGQVILSMVTAILARDALPNDITLRDLGEHRLKDLSYPEHVFQLVIPGLPSEFPPLKSLNNLEQVGAGLAALADLMSVPQVWANIKAFQGALATMCRQIDLLRSYKDLHDLLHDLQFNCYGPIARSTKRFPNDEYFRESLSDYELELQRIIISLSQVVDGATFPTNERPWIQQLSEAADCLRSAIERSDREQLDRAVAQLGRVLYIHPTRINERLKEAARALPLAVLIQIMTAVANAPAVAGLDPDKLRQVSLSVVELERLSNSLTLLIDEHDIWQEVDLDLRRIEEHLEQHMQELEWLWPDVKARTERLYHDTGDRWMQDFQQACEKLERVLTAHEPATIVAHFRRFRSRASICFFQADKRLKDLCDDLRHVDGPLALVSRMVQ